MSLIPLADVKKETSDSKLPTQPDNLEEVVSAPDFLGSSGNDNPGPTQSLVVRIPGNLLCPNFICVIAKCTGPGAMMATVCDIFERLPICKVTVFGEIFADSSEMEFRGTFGTELHDIGRDLEDQLVWRHLWELKLLTDPRLICEQFPHPHPHQTHY